MTSAGEISAPASKVKVKRERRTKIARQILDPNRFSDSFVIQLIHVASGL